MKLNYKLKVCLIAFAFIFIGSSAIATNNLKTKITSESYDSWIAVHNQNGIKVTCTPFELNGVSYLKVKFKNTTNQTIDFSWTLNEGGETVVNETTYSVKANSFVETDNNTLILFNDGASQALFSFNLKIN
ncbi:MAG: hypothetical protein P1U41_06385 [Vicingaceae bacterium]|nr:hypothetical protein [Vicingaceae bacterium]